MAAFGVLLKYMVLKVQVKHKKTKALVSKCFSLNFVRLIGLEPTHLAIPDPKSGASTNFATGAYGVQSYTLFLNCQTSRGFFEGAWVHAVC